MEKKIIFSLSDIREVRVGCSRCDGEVIVPVAGDRPTILVGGPHCGEEWNRNGTLSEFDFLSHLRQIVRLPEPRPVKLRFEIVDPDSMD